MNVSGGADDSKESCGEILKFRDQRKNKQKTPDKYEQGWCIREIKRVI